MLAQLSSTSPYVCDLNRGPIEPANRMASSPSNKATALLESKESFSKHTRAPLKLLAPDEVPMDTTTAPTDANTSLQLVWYTEQTIVDEQLTHNEDVASIIQEQQRQNKSTLSRITLPPIPSESPIDSEAIEELPNQPSLMHKSSTFTIEAAMNADSPLNDSEKENLLKDDASDAVIPPSDDSFRALEQLLGLGSGGTVRESPKTNHDTLSLTVVTPTDIINATRRSSRLSYAQKGGASSLPSSQEIPTMDTIESIASANPPSFLADNTTMEEEQPSLVSAASQLTSFDVTEVDTIKDDSNTDDETNFSFELNDFPNNSNDEPKVAAPVVPQPVPVMRAPTCADVAYRALVKPRMGGRISQPVKADSPLAKPSKARSSAPSSRGLRSSTQCATTTELAASPVITEEAALTNPEESVTSTELVEIVTLPEEDENVQDRTAAVTLNVTSAKTTEESNATVEDEPDELTTPPKAIPPMLSREYTFDSPKRRSAQRRRSTMNSLYATPTQTDPPATIAEEEALSPSIASNSMLEILMTKPTQQVVRKTSILPSPVRLSKKQAVSSPSIASQSMLGVLLTQPTASSPRATRKVSAICSPVRTSKRSVIKQLQAASPSVASQSMLEVLLTKPTEVQNPKRNTTVNPAPESPAVASQSMLEVLLTKPSQVTPRNSRRTVTGTLSARTTGRNTLNVPTTESPTVASKSMLGILLTNASEDNSTVVPETPVTPSPLQTSARRSRRSSSHPTPRVSINPLHSSTPSSSRHKPLQMVNIGEEEQLTTTVPQQVNIEIHRDEADIETAPANDTTVSVQQPSTFEIGVQTTPSLDRSMRRQMNQSAVTVEMVNIEEERQITPLQTKVIVNLQRSVRFQLTPSTDARLVAKEKMEETLRGLKPDIVIQPAPLELESQPEQTNAVPAKKRGRPKKKVFASRKKKAEPKPKAVQATPRAARKAKVVKQEKAVPAKRSARKQTPAEATKKPAAKQTPAKRTTKAITKRAAPKAAAKRIAKRTAEKRTMPKAVLESIVEHAAPKPTTTEAKPEPVPKQLAQKSKVSKAKTAVPKPKPAATKRAATKETTAEPAVEQTPTKRIAAETTAAPVAKRTKTAKPAEAPAPRSNSRRERKVPAKMVEAASEPATVMKKASKRRMPSAEKASEPAPKVEKKESQVAQPVEKTAPKEEVQSKMDGLTVAQLKSRLTKQKQDIPKAAKKADLVALLFKLETNAVQKSEVAAPTTSTTRRRKN